MMKPNIHALEGEEADRVERQRDWVRGHYVPEAQHLYETLDGKLELLKGILAQNWIEPHETWKLQSLGITFGDALAQKLGLEWVMIEDEQGRDPALYREDRGTTVLMFPKTSISKRIEDGETVDIQDLFEKACMLIKNQLPPAH